MNAKGASVTTCIIYARVSSEEQAEGEFTSIDAQINACRKKAEQNGWRVIRVLTDEVTAENLNRPGMNELIALVRIQRVDVILATKLARLVRDVVDTEFLVTLCKDRGTQLLLLHEQHDERTAIGRMQRRIGAVVNQYEREEIGDRVKRKFDEMVDVGLRPGGWAPVGLLIRGPHKYEMDDKYAPVILNIFERASAGENVASIARALAKQGIVVPARIINRRETGNSHAKKPARVGGRPFTWDQIKAIIQNPIYRSVVMRNETEYAVKVPRIVSDELWHNANRAIQQKPTGRMQSARNKHQLLFHGCLICGSCGTAMVAHPAVSRTGETYLYYRCQAVRKRGAKIGCQVKQVPARALEDAVASRLTVLADDPALIESFVQAAVKGRQKMLGPLLRDIQAHEDQIEGLRSRLGRLKEKVLALPSGSPLMRELDRDGSSLIVEAEAASVRLDELRSKRAILEQELGGGKAIAGDLRHFKAIYGKLAWDKKVRLLRLLIHRVVVNRVQSGCAAPASNPGIAESRRQKGAFLINLELFIKPRVGSTLSKVAGDFVFRPEMAARAGIEPATK